jgi:hypothetical protein
MSAPTIRRTARSLTVLAAIPLALTVVASPATARPDPGAPVADTSVVLEGCDPTAGWPTFPGWHGPCLAPELRGNVLEFVDH